MPKKKYISKAKRVGTGNIRAVPKGSAKPFTSRWAGKWGMK